MWGAETVVQKHSSAPKPAPPAVAGERSVAGATSRAAVVRGAAARGQSIRRPRAWDAETAAPRVSSETKPVTQAVVGVASEVGMTPVAATARARAQLVRLTSIHRCSPAVTVASKLKRVSAPAQTPAVGAASAGGAMSAHVLRAANAPLVLSRHRVRRSSALPPAAQALSSRRAHAPAAAPVVGEAGALGQTSKPVMAPGKSVRLEIMKWG